MTQEKANKHLDEEVWLERVDLLCGAHAKPMETLPEGTTSETRLLLALMPPIVQDRDTEKPEWKFNDGLFAKPRDTN